MIPTAPGSTPEGLSRRPKACPMAIRFGIHIPLQCASVEVVNQDLLRLEVTKTPESNPQPLSNAVKEPYVLYWKRRKVDGCKSC